MKLVRESINEKNFYIEYRTQPHEMFLEGSSDEKPSEIEITNDARKHGFDVDNININFDKFQQMWRFTADLLNIVKESLSDMPDSDKELIKQAREIKQDETRWYEVSQMEDEAISKEAKDILHNITMYMYHKEEGSNI